MSSPRESPRDTSLGSEARAAIDKPPVKRKAPVKHTSKKKTPAKKKDAPKKTKKTILDMPLDSDDKPKTEDGGAEPTGDVFIDWKDEALNHALISAITNNSKIKQGLFPSPGGNTRKGTEKPKTDHQYAIAVAIFGEYDVYKDAFALAQKPAERSVWTMKIKDRLQIMLKNCCKHTEMMGSTGSGLDNKDQILIDDGPNSIYTKWGLIKETCPWFFKLKNLISECPSVVTTGLGNNAIFYDVSILMPGHSKTTNGDGHASNGESDSGPEEVDIGGPIVFSDKEPDLDKSPKVEDTPKTPHTSQKCKAPRASISIPALSPPSKKAKGISKKFVEIAMKEEETIQKLLDIKMTKVNHEMEEKMAKLMFKTQVKMQQDWLKAGLKAKKQGWTFQLQMVQISQSSGHAANPFAGNMNLNNGGYPSINTNRITLGFNLGWPSAPTAGPLYSTSVTSSSF